MTATFVSDLAFLLHYLDYLARRGARPELRRKASLLRALIEYLDESGAPWATELETQLTAWARLLREGKPIDAADDAMFGQDASVLAEILKTVEDVVLQGR